MKHIGIAGITVPGSILCINTIVEESYKHFGQSSMKNPRITYTNPSLSDINPAISTKNIEKIAEDLLDSVGRLQKAGVDFVIIPSNAPHYAIKLVQEKAEIPVWSIVEITVTEAKARGFKKVGILGTAITMSDGLYDSPFQQKDIEPITLSPERQKELSDLIFREIIQGQPTPATAKKMKEFIQELKDLGCDSFIAGCTEIPIVITSESDSPLPFIDTTLLLAQKAFEEAIKE